MQTLGQTVGTRFYGEAVEHLDTIASALTERAKGAKVSRSDALRIVVDRGFTVMDAELSGPLAPISVKTEKVSEPLAPISVITEEKPVYFSGILNGKKVDITRLTKTKNEHTLVFMAIEGDLELWHDLAAKIWDKYPTLSELRARVLEHLKTEQKEIK